MRLLVVHQNFPGQFGHLVRAWAARPGWDVRAIGRDTAPGLAGFDGLVRYRPTRDGHGAQHPYLRQMESATLHGQAVARVMLALRNSGFTPDAILAHPGWGETLFAKDVYPDARLVHYCEWFYSAEGADLGFDPEFPITFSVLASDVPPVREVLGAGRGALPLRLLRHRPPGRADPGPARRPGRSARFQGAHGALRPAARRSGVRATDRAAASPSARSAPAAAAVRPRATPMSQHA